MPKGQHFIHWLSAVLYFACPIVLCQDVDQATGEDLNPQGRGFSGGTGEDSAARNPDRPSTMPLVSMPDMDERREKKAIKRISSPERWEIKQMIAANVIDKSELPDFDEETGILPKDDESGTFTNAGLFCVNHGDQNIFLKL